MSFNKSCTVAHVLMIDLTSSCCLIVIRFEERTREDIICNHKIDESMVNLINFIWTNILVMRCRDKRGQRQFNFVVVFSD